jgi:hypothetical protein
MKEVPRQANFDTRPLAQYQTPWNQAPRHQAPWNQAPKHQAPQYQDPWHQAPWHQVPRHHAPRCQGPQHQQSQQRFVLAKQNDKLKTNKSKQFKRPQKVEDDQYCTYLDAKHDTVDGSSDEDLPTTTDKKAGMG